ncbi:glycosyltransferase family 25 protein [Rhizobium tumorigenes]|uniref:glycosyltransferase family 25 protein n=1 Tax=Rhizobium tumorigenes TaxID=2041385 RepID=UPI00241DCCC2|nr:glycosyltransferase family 25 protein [Rhizobium tumorigenes]WFS01321.1 glycosyltransferase family 25 protein [Rhizobium tumorigenes]
MHNAYHLERPQSLGLQKRATSVESSLSLKVEPSARPQTIKAFIVHLGRAEQRAGQVERLVETLPVPAEIIDAVDGLALSQADRERVYHRNLHKPAYPFQLSNSEIACFLSHRKAWAAIVEQGLDAGFVIEDDVELTADFPAAFAAASACLTPGAFVRFPFRDNRESGEEVFSQDTARVIRPQVIGLGMVAQLVSRGAAIRLLQATEIFDRPVDTMVQMEWLLHLSPLTVLPGGVREISSTLGGTSMKRHSTFAEKLTREVMRPLYRAKVAFRSRYFV